MVVTRNKNNLRKEFLVGSPPPPDVSVVTVFTFLIIIGYREVNVTGATKYQNYHPNQWTYFGRLDDRYIY